MDLDKLEDNLLKWGKNRKLLSLDMKFVIIVSELINRINEEEYKKNVSVINI